MGADFSCPKLCPYVCPKILNLFPNFGQIPKFWGLQLPPPPLNWLGAARIQLDGEAGNRVPNKGGGTSPAAAVADPGSILGGGGGAWELTPL